MEKKEQQAKQELFILLAKNSNNISKIKELLEEINNNNLKMGNVSYLSVACANNNKEIIELIIQKGANVNDADHNNRIALHEACRNGNLEVVKLLVENGADIYIKEKGGKTALHFAVQMINNENLEILKYLKSKGADLLIKDEKNNNLLHEVVAMKNNVNETINIIKYLINEKVGINDQNERGKTPLMNAISLTKDVEIIKLLVESGADINIKNDVDKKAIDLAIRGREHEILNVLLKYHKNINEKNKEGDTLLHDACKIPNNVEVINLLINHGIDINLKNFEKQTALEVMKEKREQFESLKYDYNENINFLELYNLYKELKEETKEEYKSEIKTSKSKI